MKHLIFEHCRKGLGRPQLLDYKIYNSEPVRLLVQNFDESHKPYQAPYSNRQVQIICLSNINKVSIGSVLWASPLKICPFPEKGSSKLSLLVKDILNTGSRNDLFLPLDRSDRTNDRQPQFENLNESQDFLTGLRGFVTCFFSLFKTSLSPAWLFTLNSLI